ELRSWPTRPAEWNVEPEVSSARSTRTMSVQPRSARWYATDVPPTPPPMMTARASSAMRTAYRAARRLVASCHAPGRSHRRPGSMTERAAGVSDLALDRQELPVVVRGVEGQSEHAVDRGVTELAVRCLALELAEHGAAGSHDELAKAAGPGLDAGGVLRRKPLVVVIVAVDHKLGVRRVQGVPERGNPRVVPVLAGAEPRVMPDRERAVGRAGRQVVGEPFALRRRRSAAANLVAVRIEDDDVPRPEIHRVPGHALRRCRRYEVVPVAPRVGGVPVVVPGGRQEGPIADATPCRLVAI